MKKIISLILAVMMLCCFAMAEDASLNDVIARGELILGLDDSFLPWLQ